MGEKWGYNLAHENRLYDILGELGVTFTRATPIRDFNLNDSVLFLFKNGLAKENDPHFFCFFMGSYLLFNDVYQKYKTLDYVMKHLSGSDEEAVCRGLVELLRRKVDGKKDESVRVHQCGPHIYTKMQKIMGYRSGYPDVFDNDFAEIFGVKMFKLEAQPCRKYYLREYLAKSRPEIWGK